MIRNFKKIIRDEDAVGTMSLTMGVILGAILAAVGCSLGLVASLPLVCLNMICQCLTPTPQGPSILEKLLAIIG